jgi:hypothetical protein
MSATTYSEFRQELFDRHQNGFTSVLSTVGDAFPALGVVAAIATRNRQWAFRGLWGGLAVASVAHLFQPGTLLAEYVAIARHPVWAARAELDRVLSAHKLQVPLALD